MDSTNAESIEKAVLDVLIHLQLDIKSCRGKGYDRTSNMSCKYSGFAARIMEKEPKAIYVHCATHNLQLILQDVSTFFDTVRTSSLDSVLSNYGTLLEELGILAQENSDCCKQANGFQASMSRFLSLWTEAMRSNFLPSRRDKPHFAVTTSYNHLDMPCKQFNHRAIIFCTGRLKTFLQSNMTQPRLNHLLLLDIHKDKCDELSVEEVAEEFIEKNDHRRSCFQSFYNY
ncbi:hypothetical protein PR048_012922 [Dryococelus australis]|uniref:DUF4371 domain-containing protein n=1 Tax=Dryococelus australis TaxID=614101 RepID=A0ABQ9HQQ9_9NEOP|nr:hypothetical protein PR048_012922 [Dryococelus australis]